MATFHPLDNTMVSAHLTPTCAQCGRVRDAVGRWHRAEPLPAGYEDELVTHTICPTCLKRLYPEFLRRRQLQRKPD
jgi:phage terminase large subunit-like protein